MSHSQVLNKRRHCLDAREPFKKVHKFYTGGVHYTQDNQRVCTLLDDIVISNSSTDEILVFNKGGKLVHRFDGQEEEWGEFNEPTGLCTLPGGDTLLVADSKNERIQVFDSKYNFIRSISIPGFQPRMIATTSKGKILVTTDKKKALILDQGGHILKEFGSLDEYQFLWICCNTKNQIFLLDSDRWDVRMFTENGEPLDKPVFSRKKENYFWIPEGICTDWEDNIFVCDHMGGISIFDCEGNLIQHIPVPAPCDLCLMNNWLIVSTYENLVHIFSN